MKEEEGDLWFVPADARVITTNGSVKSNGRAVMGRGVARQAAERFFAVQLKLGALIKANGNQVQIIPILELKEPLVSFPVKHEWYERADLELIAHSARELVALTDQHGWRRVVLPRPGCNNGKRDWVTEVRPILQPVLDDRFVVVQR